MKGYITIDNADGKSHFIKTAAIVLIIDGDDYRQVVVNAGEKLAFRTNTAYNDLIKLIESDIG